MKYGNINGGIVTEWMNYINLNGRMVSKWMNYMNLNGERSVNASNIRIKMDE